MEPTQLPPQQPLQPPLQPITPPGQMPPPVMPVQQPVPPQQPLTPAAVPAQTVQNPLTAMRPGETVICEIKRHPFGLVSIYLTFAVLLAIVGGLALLAPSFLTSYDQQYIYEIGAAVFLATLIFCGLFASLAAKIYHGNRWILTSDSLTQVSQKGLFDKQSSQLSLGNLEDVTSRQDGIVAHMFGFGVLHVETAGERSKFVFPFCPKPNEAAQKILIAREAFEQEQRSSVAPQQQYYPPQATTQT